MMMLMRFRGVSMKWLKLTRTKIVTGVLAIALLVSVPVVASESVTQSVEGGDRSASVSGVDLGTVEYSHESQTSDGSISILVDDSTGSDAGWNVTVYASDFTDGDRTIGAEKFSITGAGNPVHLEGQEIDSGNGPKVPDSGGTGSLDVPRKVLNASEGYGKGTYSQELDVQLLVPGQTLAGSYGASLTVDIAAGP
jgi:hypothetical protein